MKKSAIKKQGRYGKICDSYKLVIKQKKYESNKENANKSTKN